MKLWNEKYFREKFLNFLIALVLKNFSSSIAIQGQFCKKQTAASSNDIDSSRFARFLSDNQGQLHCHLSWYVTNCST